MADKEDDIMREFNREILSFKDAAGIPNAAFAGMLIGAAATMAQIGGITLDHMLKIATNCYKAAEADKDLPRKPANDLSGKAN